VNKSAVPPNPKEGKPRKKRRSIGGADKPRSLFIDPVEFAEQTGFSVKSIYEQVGRGVLPYSRHGGRILFERSQIEIFLAKLRVVTVDEALRNARQGTTE